MITKARKLSFFPKKLKATRIRFEHRLGCANHLTVVMYDVDFPKALERFKSFLDLKIGLIKISAVYGESKIYEHEIRVSELLDHYAATELLLY